MQRTKGSGASCIAILDVMMANTEAPYHTRMSSETVDVLAGIAEMDTAGHLHRALAGDKLILGQAKISRAACRR
jgi:hypothetical protein